MSSVWVDRGMASLIAGNVVSAKRKASLRGLGVGIMATKVETVAPIAVQKIMATDPAHARLAHDAAYEGGAAFVIDHYCPLREAAVPITDLGFGRADAVYDVVSVSRGQYFRLGHHQERFSKSLEKFRLRSPFSFEEERDLLDKLMSLTGLKDAYVWWAVTRGATPSRSADRLDPTKFQNRYFAYVLPYLFIGTDEQRARGIDLILSDRHVRIPPKSVDPRAKNFHGLDLAMSLYEAGERGGEWSVLPDLDGNLTESPGSNIFIIKNGVVATPESGCLEGITRQTVIDLCDLMGIPCEVRTVHSRELLTADEAFMTSTAGGVMPVSSVNSVPLGGVNGPGELASRIHNEYWRRRWDGWDSVPVNYEK